MELTFAFNPGIYKITCQKNRKAYIGESVNCLDRLGRHSYNLTMQYHLCFQLQHDFNVLGREAFKFKILFYGPAYEDKAFRKQREAELILVHQKKKGLTYKGDPTKQSQDRFLQSVSIKEQVYPGLREAALNIKPQESRTNLRRKCNNPNIADYFFLEQVVYDAKKHAKRTCLPVVIFGAFILALQRRQALVRKVPKLYTRYVRMSRF